MKHDLRWLLWLAWPCFAVSIWWAARRTREVLLITILGTVVAGCGLLWLGNWLRPEKLEGEKSDSQLAQQSAPSVPQNKPEPRRVSDTSPAIPNNHPTKNREKQKAIVLPQPQNQPIVPPGSLLQNNSGGINVQQGTTGSNSPIINSPITIGNIPKEISSSDMAALTEYFLGAKSKAQVRIFADQDSGSVPLPENFYDALKGGGWTMIDRGAEVTQAFYRPGKVFQGAVVTITGNPLTDGRTVSVNDLDPVFYIGNALKALKIPCILKQAKDQPQGVISVDFIGGFPD